MKTNVLDHIDFKKVNTLLEGFNKSTGFVTAILDMDGNVLSKSGWRQICTEFHRVNPETGRKCRNSDTILANKMAEGEKYHFYKCLNGLIDVAVPVIINGEHIANLFSGQFFFEKPDIQFFKNQAAEYGFEEEKYIEAMENVPVVSEKKVKTSIDFLLSMTQMICEMTFQKLEQTESNKTIIESEGKFKAVFESANVGKSITSPTGEINVNQAFCDMLGYTREELQNKKWQDLTPEDEIPVIQAFTNTLVIGEKNSVRFEKRYICKDGSYIWTDVSVSIRRDDNGKPLHLITTVIDITDRKQAENSILESEKQYRSLFENMNSGIVLFEVVQNEQGIPVDLIIRAANEGFEKTTELNLKDAVGQQLTKVLPGIEKDEANWIGTYSKVALSGEPTCFEQGSELLGYYYSISAFQAEPKQCAVTFVDISERKKAEDDLANEATRRRVLMDQSKDGIVVLDQDGKVFESNKSFADMLGYSLESMCQLNVLDWEFQYPPKQVIEMIRSVDEKGDHFESKHRRKDGSVYDVEISTNAAWFKGRKLIFCICRDITDSKRRDEALRRSESRLNRALENIPDVVVIYDNDLKIQFINATTSRVTGRPASDFIGKREEEIWPPEVYQVYLPMLQESFTTGEVRSLDTKLTFPNRDTRNLRITCVPLLDEKGDVREVMGVTNDFTIRKQAENALRQSEEKFSIMFRKTPFSAALSSISDLKLVEVNDQFEKYWGYSSAEAIGRTSSELGLYPDDNERSRLTAIFRSCGFIHDIETKMKSKFGELKDVLINSNIVNIGNEQFVLSTVQDITERKKLDFERHKFVMLADSSSEFIGMCDLNFQPIYVNPSGIRMVGLTDIDEACRVKVQDYFFPEDQRFIVEEFYPRVLSEGDGDIEIRLRHFQTGETIWVLYYLFRVCDSAGKPVGWATVSHDITERKQIEEKIRENSSLIRIAAEKAKLGGWNVDLNENRSYWSDEVAAIHEMPFGFAPLVEDGINFYAPEWRERIIQVFTDCAGNGVPYDEEMEIITSTGKRVWVRTIGEAVRDENGNIYKVEGAFQDISEKKLAEAKVREKDLQFRKLSANVPDLIFQFTRKPDGSYCVPVASEGIMNIFGCTPQDVVDDFTPIGKVIYPDDAERVMADIEYSARNLTYFTCEFRVHIPGRPVQWILSRSSPEKLPDGSVTWYGFNANITDRKEAEEALKESEGKFRKIYEDGPYGMSLVNNEYKFIMANRTFCEIMGYTESELKKLTFNDITFPDDKSKGMESVKQLIKGKIPVVKLEKRYVRKNGQVIWGSITVAANFDKNGNFLYKLAIVEDITGRKKAAEEIRILNSELEKRVNERTEQLEIVNKELEAFSYSVSHDLRAPLRHINGFAEVLRKQYSEELSDDARKHLNTIIASAQKMGILIDDLLSFSRTGRAELKKSSLSMEQIVKDAMNHIVPAGKDRKIDWNISPLPEVNGDYNLLRLAWVNLIDNAVKYTAPKEIAKINIDYKVDKNMFVFHISDNGVGFDMNYSHKLFGVFQRLHSSTQFDGTGIGLANVRRIILRHGGNTWAEAKPGKGATFYFSLPKIMEDKL